MKMATKIEQLSLNEIQTQMDRNMRLINLCINIPVVCKFDQPLSENRKKYYLDKKDFTIIIREMFCDDIRLDDIANVMQLSVYDIFSRKPRYPAWTPKDVLQVGCSLIKNIEDYRSMM